MTEPTLAPSGREVEMPRGSKRPLSEAYDVALLDLDGVVYLGACRRARRAPTRWPRPSAGGCGSHS